MLVLWAAVFILMVIIEAATVGLATCWFALGALAAFITALFNVPVVAQIIVFFAVSLLLLIFTRPIAKKVLAVKFNATNFDRCIGKIAIAEERIDNIAGTGIIKIDGVEWTARSDDEKITIEKGAHVRIVGIEGVKVHVQKVDGES